MKKSNIFKRSITVFFFCPKCKLFCISNMLIQKIIISYFVIFYTIDETGPSHSYEIGISNVKRYMFSNVMPLVLFHNMFIVCFRSYVMCVSLMQIVLQNINLTVVIVRNFHKFLNL